MPDKQEIDFNYLSEKMSQINEIAQEIGNRAKVIDQIKDTYSNGETYKSYTRTIEHFSDTCDAISNIITKYYLMLDFARVNYKDIDTKMYNELHK